LSFYSLNEEENRNWDFDFSQHGSSNKKIINWTSLKGINNEKPWVSTQGKKKKPQTASDMDLINEIHYLLAEDRGGKYISNNSLRI